MNLPDPIRQPLNLVIAGALIARWAARKAWRALTARAKQVRVAGWTLIVCGLSIACSQIPTLQPNTGVFVLGLFIGLAGALIVSDGGARGRDR